MSTQPDAENKPTSFLEQNYTKNERGFYVSNGNPPNTETLEEKIRSLLMLSLKFKPDTSAK